MNVSHKISTIVFGLALLTTTAHAGNHRQIAPVAQLTVASVWPQEFRDDVIIYGDGRVTTSTNGSSETLVATLEPKILDKMAAVIETIVPGELNPADPEAPACQDAPTYTFVVFKDSEAVKTKQIMGCKEYYSDAGYSAFAINDLLSAFSRLDM